MSYEHTQTCYIYRQSFSETNELKLIDSINHISQQRNDVSNYNQMLLDTTLIGGKSHCIFKQLNAQSNLNTS